MLREAEYSQAIEDAVLQVSKALLGKEHQIRLALSEDLSLYQLARKVGEGPVDFHDRVVAQLPEISGLMSQFTGVYISAIYGSVQLSEAEEKQGLTQLRQLLKEIKQRLRHIQPVKSAQF